MSGAHSNLYCGSAFSYLHPVLLSIIVTVVHNAEHRKSGFSLIVHKGGMTTHLKVGVNAVYLSICFKSHISYE